MLDNRFVYEFNMILFFFHKWFDFFFYIISEENQLEESLKEERMKIQMIHRKRKVDF